MKRKLFWFCLIGFIVYASMASAQSAYINGKTANRVHLRSAPSRTSESMGLFYTGTEVELYHSALQETWVRVEIGAQSGYVMSEYLQADHPSASMPACYVKTNTLNLRAGPSTQTEVLRILPKDEKMVILGQTSNDWYYVHCTDGVTGYVTPEYVVLTGESISLQNAAVQKVGETFDGYNIYSWLAPNGQTLYFSGSDDPGIKWEDVNFDGHDDVVVCIIRGASNFFFEFFVWDNGQYVRAGNDGMEYGLCNYHLYPEYGIVHSDTNNGNAGALHEDVLLRWEGTKLKIIRRAVSEEWTETTRFEKGQGYTTSTSLETLHVRVWDYSQHVYEGELIYETLINLQEINSSEDFDRLFSEEQQMLWKGIK